MNKLDEKDIIRHYLLNLLTVLNIEISNFNIKKADKEKCDNLISVASILIANENIFMNDKSAIFIQGIDLVDLLELNCQILESSINKNNIKIKMPESDLTIKADKFYFSEALKYILKELIKDSKNIEFSIDKTQKKLNILHDKKSDLPTPADNIIDLLKSKNFDKNDITFQLACTIIKIHNFDLKIEKNKIGIKF